MDRGREVTLPWCALCPRVACRLWAEPRSTATTDSTVPHSQHIGCNKDRIVMAHRSPRPQSPVRQSPHNPHGCSMVVNPHQGCKCVQLTQRCKSTYSLWERPFRLAVVSIRHHLPYFLCAACWPCAGPCARTPFELRHVSLLAKLSLSARSDTLQCGQGKAKLDPCCARTPSA